MADLVEEVQQPGSGRSVELGVGLLTGGALGNLADRIRAGGVTDFLDAPLWPAFNLADVAIIALSALSPEPRPGATDP